MNRLKVLMVSASSSLAVGIEEVLQQTGYLDQFHYVGLDNLPQTFSAGSVVDLVCVQYLPEQSAEIFAFLSAALRAGAPPIFFFIEAYDPPVVLHLINQGGRRVLPIDGIQHLLPASLEAVFGPADGPSSTPGFLAAGQLEQKEPYSALIACDISEFKRIEQELRDSREEYRTLAEAAHDYIFVVNTQGMVEYANRFACQALGHNIERVAGMSVARFFPDRYSSEILQMISEVREIDSAVYTEGALRLADREHWLGTWLVPVHNSNGKLVSILGISRDISEQRKTDEALKRALENEKQINQMQSSFFAMTSHQFRTPLSSILLSTEMLKKYGPRWDEPKRLEYLDRIEESSDRLSALLENIQIISRVDSGNYQIQQKTFDLIEFCAQIIQELTANDRNEHPVTFLHSSDRLMVCSDPNLLRHILDNVIRNAFKYSPQGSPVQIKLSCEEWLVVLEVHDVGIGIPEKDQKHLFQPFQRASNTDAYPGTGIGLTIVKKSVELLNGHIFVKSKEGQGTTFLIRFPGGRLENGLFNETRVI